MQRNSFKPPVREGEELDVRIEAVGGKGDGIAKVKGFVLFVANTKEGETCRVRITKVLSKVGFAEKIGEAHAAPEEVPAQQVAPSELPDIEPENPPEDETDSEDFGAELEDNF